MGIISSLFSSSAAVNAAAKGVDSVVFTEQERKELHTKMLPLYEPFRLTQRILAFAIVLPFAFWSSFLLATDAYYVLWLNADPIAGSLQSTNIDNMGMAASIVLLFYFGGGAAEGIFRLRK